ELCDAVTPSLVDRDPVVVAIGTEGTAPVLARQIKTRVETLLEPNLGGLAALAGRLRGAVATGIPRAKRRAFWEWVFGGDVRALHARGAEREAATRLKDAISGDGAFGAETSGHIALVGAGPGARDLLTLRAVQRLQTADVIFYDRLVDPDVLELARRDAERVYVGKSVGACAWPQDRINALIVAEAAKGRRVVRLKSGDPGVFGRTEEELSAARNADIPVEIVPGITAASAAAASLGRALTERGETERVVLATGTSRAGDPAPEVAALAEPGTTLAFYMACRNARSIADSLAAAGWPGSTEVQAVAKASWADETQVSCTLATLRESFDALGIESPAVIFVRLPKDSAAQPRLATTG
ncbi:MAG: siroheme synthase CysG, partial [Pseudomonadota bacterium]